MTLHDDITGLGERFIEWPEDREVTLRANEGVRSGLRLSTDCPARRILEYLEPEEFGMVTRGVSLTGHLFADLFIQTCLPEDVSVEYEIDWGLGKTALDAVVWEGPLAAHYELKTSSAKNPHPSLDNRRQVCRVRVAAERAGVELPDSVIFIIGKAGHLSGFVYGPFPAMPTADELRLTHDELDLTDAVFEEVKGMENPREHPALKMMCRCALCYPPTPEEAEDDLRRMLDGEYEQLIGDYMAAKEWNDRFKERVKQMVQPDSEVLSARWRVRVSKTGRMTIARRKL